MSRASIRVRAIPRAAGPMPERQYRASRWCRVLGNPTAYRVLKTLADGPRAPSELAAELGRGLANVSMTLRHLRELDLVRYRRQGTRLLYRLKSPRVAPVLEAMERAVAELGPATP